MTETLDDGDKSIGEDDASSVFNGLQGCWGWVMLDRVGVVGGWIKRR